MACWPNGSQTRPAISSPYGPRDPRIGTSAFHYGTDFVGFPTLVAILPGRVTAVGVLPGWKAGGIQVVVDHGGGIVTRTMHLKSAAVSVGQSVIQGQALGTMGKTGNATGVCGHVEVRINGAAVDPVAWIGARLGAPTTGGIAAPGFPLASGSYFGPRYPLTNRRSVSGYYGHRDDLRRWQQRMADRGWSITPDGLYGDQTRNVALAFQREKGLTPDGLIGPATWSAAWTAPVT
jgi:murein DD-endopeptidase MepM/ murein hydrolase activator NlpD